MAKIIEKYMHYAVTYLEDCDSSPENIVEMFPITHTLRVVVHDFVTITLPGSV
jgi:hypothetical protein